MHGLLVTQQEIIVVVAVSETADVIQTVYHHQRYGDRQVVFNVKISPINFTTKLVLRVSKVSK